jgi:serine phosphatase RsbU (regulator of sigma subunit)
VSDSDALDPGAFRVAFESSPALVAVVAGPEQRLVFQNRASRELFGAFALGQPLDVAVPGADAWARVEEVRLSGRVSDVPRAKVGVRDRSGGELLITYVLAPLGDGPPYPGVMITALDVTHEVRAEEHAARAELLSSLSTAMSAAADPEGALQALTDSMVPPMADIAAVVVLPEHVSDFSEQVPPTVMTIRRDLLERVGPPPQPGEPRSPGGPWNATLAAGRTVLLDPSDPVVRDSVDEPTLGWLDSAGCTSLVVLPLVVAGRLSGAVVLGATRPRPPFTADDLRFLQDAAARAGAAVSAQRDLRRQRQLAFDLQRALLPAAPPRLHGMDIAARYIAGAEGVAIGGDWWDVAHLGAGRVGVGVRDVSGRGVPAAVVMGQIRAAMRAAAHADLSPGDLLNLLDAHTYDLLPDPRPDEVGIPPRFATAVYCVLEPYDEVLTVASAGHPPVLVRRPGSGVDVVAPTPGPPLGLRMGPFPELRVPFPPGSLLMVCTDGLVEVRTQDLDAGLADAAAVLAGLAPDAPVDAVADALLGRLAPAAGDDDIALVVLRSATSGAPLGRLELTVSEAAELRSARGAVRDLAAAHLPSVVEAAVLVADELLSNALEHAGAPAKLRAYVTPDRLVVEVTDTSALVPRAADRAVDDDRGRGLALVSELADAWGTRLSRLGKTTWAEFRAPA